MDFRLRLFRSLAGSWKQQNWSLLTTQSTNIGHSTRRAESPTFSKSPLSFEHGAIMLKLREALPTTTRPR